MRKKNYDFVFTAKPDIHKKISLHRNKRISLNLNQIIYYTGIIISVFSKILQKYFNRRHIVDFYEKKA